MLWEYLRNMTNAWLTYNVMWLNDKIDIYIQGDILLPIPFF